MVAPNFSLGASLLIHLARFAAKFFDHAEIMEMHHDKKIDAPSGTAIATARAMSQTHGKPFIHTKAERKIISNTRGGQMDGIAIHSLRLPGFMAGQQTRSGVIAAYPDINALYRMSFSLSRAKASSVVIT